MATLVTPITPISEEAHRLLDVLEEGGVEVARFSEVDGLGYSVTWEFHGQRHVSGGPTLEEALAYVVFHIGLGR